MVTVYSNSIDSLCDYFVDPTSRMHATDNKVVRGVDLVCSDDLAGGSCNPNMSSILKTGQLERFRI